MFCKNRTFFKAVAWMVELGGCGCEIAEAGAEAPCRAREEGGRRSAEAEVRREMSKPKLAIGSSTNGRHLVASPRCGFQTSEDWFLVERSSQTQGLHHASPYGPRNN